MTTHFILYVHDQGRSAAFYEAVLGAAPRLNVPGMTEFSLSSDSVLGLMPERGITSLLGPSFPDPSQANGVPRAELYLVVPDAQAVVERATFAGARLVSPLQLRGWGHSVAYLLDPDGHVLALAESAP